MPDGVVYMFWDCQKCGTKKIRGDHDKCTTCGEDRTSQCYVVEGEGEITDAAEIAEAFKGPDWTCGSCGAVNDASNQTCRECSALKDGGTSHSVIEYQPGVIPSATDEDQQHEDMTFDGRQSAYRPNISVSDLSRTENFGSRQLAIGSSSKVKMAIVALAILAITFVGYLVLRPYKVEVEVSGFEWTRVVDLEKYAWVSDSNTSGYPAESRNQSRAWEVIGHHQEFSHYDTKYRTVYDTVQDGETCSYTDLGNGRASRSCSPNYRQVSSQESYQEAVYRSVADWGWRYSFEVQRWIHSRSPQTGSTDRNAYWPEFTLADGSEPEREVGRTERYLIHYQDSEGKRYTRQVEYPEWSVYNVNSHYTLELNGLGTILSIEEKRQ